MESVPIIYSGPPAARTLQPSARIFSLLVSVACLAVLGTAASIQPNPQGVSTHTSLGLNDCQFLARTGLPCPSCGMTTSFAWFVRGKIAASLYVQPMGTVLAAGAAITFWVALYIGITGKSISRLMRMIPVRYYLSPLLGWGILAWGWKIFIHLRGMDGWR
jgi:hypothetical protein